MVDFVQIWNWYSREKVRKAILDFAKNREVVSVFSDGSYGRRPDCLNYDGDILQAVAEGTVAFHSSVERWENPMRLDVGMKREDLNNLRIGWDLLIDLDVKDFEIAKIATKKFIEALKDHGVKNIGVKFTGNKSFHIIVAFESFPSKVNGIPTKNLYPELPQKIIEYLKWYVKEELKEDLLALDNPNNISQRVGKPLKEIMEKDELDPFKVITVDIFGSRHLFRMPYSLNENTMLVSLPIKIEEIDSFEKEQAEIKKAKVEESFIKILAKEDATGLVIEALDWYDKYHKEEEITRVEISKLPKKPISKKSKIPEEFFPPCIKKILEGLSDGRKRAIFILVTFLRNMNWSMEEIEKKMYEWNEKNKPPLRANYLRTQLRWHFRQDRNLLPPNCDNKSFYEDMGLKEFCDECSKLGFKNPVNYPFLILKRKKRRK
jgi:DNA primase catalytic subunit